MTHPIDPRLTQIVLHEAQRQQHQIQLIASENYASQAVMQLQGSLLTNKYAEGYPGARYYGGCEFVDEAENLAIKYAQQLYHCDYVNVQPHSGSQANQAVYLSVLNPGDTLMGLALDAGGHLTHGSSVNFSGRIYKAVAYNLDKKTQRLDYDAIRTLAKKHRPKILIAGYSAYPRAIDWEAFRSIADEVEAVFHVDMAHISGLIAANVLSSPVDTADIITSTTHKTLRGPRGGMIIAKEHNALTKKVNFALFPGIQGGPLMHTIAAKAQAYHEALQKGFTHYQQSVVKNAQAMCAVFKEEGIPVITGGTDTHIVLIDVTSLGLTGQEAEHILEKVNIITNKNTIPYDPQPPKITSGIRIGTAAMTTRGVDVSSAKLIAKLICQTLKSPNTSSEHQRIAKEVTELCHQYPIYRSLFADQPLIEE